MTATLAMQLYHTYHHAYCLLYVSLSRVPPNLSNSLHSFPLLFPSLYNHQYTYFLSSSIVRQQLSAEHNFDKNGLISDLYSRFRSNGADDSRLESRISIDQCQPMGIKLNLQLRVSTHRPVIAPNIVIVAFLFD